MSPRPRTRIYRKVEIGVWNDGEFLSFDDDARLLWLFFLTGTSTISIPGVVVASRGALADKLGWPLRRLERAYDKLSDAGMVEEDWRAGVVVLRKALIGSDGAPRDTARPEGPNVFRTWAEAFSRIPECDLRDRLLGRLTELAGHLSTAMQRHFHEAFSRYLGSDMGSADPSDMGNDNPSDKASDKASDMACRIQVTGNRKQVETAARSPARARDPSTPEPGVRSTEPVVRARGAAVAQELWQEHCAAYAALRDAIDPSRPGLDRGNQPLGLRDLRQRVLDYQDPDEARKACRHVLAVRRQEAESKRDLRWFGDLVWREDQFSRALSQSPPRSETKQRQEFVPHLLPLPEGV